MNQLTPRACIALCLLIPLALLAANCGSDSDSTSPAETSAPQTSTSTTSLPASPPSTTSAPKQTTPEPTTTTTLNATAEAAPTTATPTTTPPTTTTTTTEPPPTTTTTVASTIAVAPASGIATPSGESTDAECAVTDNLIVHVEYDGLPASVQPFGCGSVLVESFPAEVLSGEMSLLFDLSDDLDRETAGAEDILLALLGKVAANLERELSDQETQVKHQGEGVWVDGAGNRYLVKDSAAIAEAALPNPPDTGRETETTLPAPPPTLLTAGDTFITTGNVYSCAQHQDGTMSCWYHNPNKVTAITAGGSHFCALHQDGAISCWGRNGSGQLGNGQSGSNVLSLVPVQVTGITDAIAITASSAHSCALHRNGTISCWGSNGTGQLGNGQSGANAHSSVPVQVTGISDATDITTGELHSCALHRNGTISCWGHNTFGQLGNGQSGSSQSDDSANSLVPVQVLNITDATAIASGSRYSCALHRNGTISCWGNNWVGQLGNGQSGDNAHSSVPVQVTGISDATAINTGCALRQNGTISCWGENSLGQLGNGQVGDHSSVPVQVTGITDATAINTGGWQSCALHRNGTVSCWGNYWSYFLGYEDGRGSLVPVRVAGIEDATAITTSDRRSCALHRNGTISCWDDDNLTPFKVSGFGG